MVFLSSSWIFGTGSRTGRGRFGIRGVLTDSMAKTFSIMLNFQQRVLQPCFVVPVHSTTVFAGGGVVGELVE